MPTDQVKMLNAPVDESEVRGAVLSMKAGKSPGLDGFPVEYFQKHIDIVALILTKVYREVFAEGLLPLTFNEAVITVLLKKDDNEPSSFRPISLVNVDCKVLAMMKIGESFTASY